jgi:hypothetical protein
VLKRKKIVLDLPPKSSQPATPGSDNKNNNKTTKTTTTTTTKIRTNERAPVGQWLPAADAL